MKKLSISLISLLASTIVSSAVESTEVRKWTSNDGKTILGRATALEGDMVTIVLTSNKTFKFSLSKLNTRDQMFLKDHFPSPVVEEEVVEEAPTLDEPETTPRGRRGKRGRGRGKAGNLAIEKQDSAGKSFYYHFVPSTAIETGTKPALFWTSGGRAGNERDVAQFSKAMELTGVTVIACGNSSNKTAGNTTHMGNNIKHAMTHLNINPERLFFSGSSGGGQRSLQNADKYPCAGAMPSVAYIGDTKPSKSNFYYVIGGAFDFNRYASSHIAKVLGSNAVHTFTPGGHGGVDAEGLNDGLIWLYTCNAYLRKTADQAELLAFEDRFYDYLTNDLSAEPWKAYYWTDHLLNKCKLNGDNRSKFASLNSTLAADPKNVLYLEGKEELEKFSKKYMSDKSTGSVMKFLDKKVQKAAAQLAEKYASLPRLKQIATDLGRKTDSL